jgi:hypothetical protein
MQFFMFSEFPCPPEGEGFEDFGRDDGTGFLVTWLRQRKIDLRHQACQTR